MGNSHPKKRGPQISTNREGRTSSAMGSGTKSPRRPPPPEPPLASAMSEEETVFSKHHGYDSGQSSAVDPNLSTKKKYALIRDNFTTLEQVCCACSSFCFRFFFCERFKICMYASLSVQCLAFSLLDSTSSPLFLGMFFNFIDLRIGCLLWIDI